MLLRLAKMQKALISDSEGVKLAILSSMARMVTRNVTRESEGREGMAVD
jgi:hypothetical protein